MSGLRFEEKPLCKAKAKNLIRNVLSVRLLLV